MAEAMAPLVSIGDLLKPLLDGVGRMSGFDGVVSGIAREQPTRFEPALPVNV
jgi:hypothetical protein